MSTNLVEHKDTKKEQQQQATQIQRSQLQMLLHRLQAGGGGLPDFLKHLVYVQAIVVAGTEASAFLLEVSENGQPSLRNIEHIRPDKSTEDVRKRALEAFSKLVVDCIKENRDDFVMVGPANENTEQQYCLITLMRAETRVVAATAVITRCLDDTRAKQRLESMQLVAGYFDMFLLRRGTEQVRLQAQNHQDVLQYASSFATSEGFKAGIANLCNELAARTGASRVSLGWVKRKREDGRDAVQLQGLSHTEEFDKRQELSVSIVKVMEECLDQQEIVQFDPEGQSTQNITRDASALSRLEGGNRVLSMPLRNKGETVGIITIEFPPDRKPTDHETTGLAVAAEVLAPQLYDRYQNDRWLITKAGLSVARVAKAAVGPSHWTAKILTTLALILFWVLGGAWVPGMGFTFAPMYRVKGNFQFAPITRSLVSSPVEGQIDKVLVQEGDFVTAGQTLMTLDTRLLETELFQRQYEQRESELRASSLENATYDERRPNALSEAVIERLKAQGVGEQIKLLQIKIEQGNIKAIAAGQILNGDLKDRIGSKVNQGEQLFEIAPPGDLRMEMSVGERDIQQIKKAGHGQLRTSSRPDEKHAFTVDRIVPLGEAKEGGNFFKVYANLDNGTNSDWYPGMAGEAAIDVGPKPLLWQWTHRLGDWVVLKLWL